MLLSVSERLELYVTHQFYTVMLMILLD